MPTPRSARFQEGQVVLIKGGELDGVVGTIVSIQYNGKTQHSANLQVRRGSGDGITNCKTEFLELVPPEKSRWATGDEVAVLIEDHRGYERLREASVLEQSAGANGTFVFVEMEDGMMFWVDSRKVRPRLRIPQFESIEEADAWADQHRWPGTK